MSTAVVRTGVGRLALGPIRALQREADRRGHGNATFGAGVGAGVGAMIGSFWGPGGALIGGAVLGLVGYAVGGEFD